MAVNSKQKGSAFERQVCKSLSLAITGGKRDDTLWRSAMSGGRATVAAKKGQLISHAAGDLTAVHPLANPFINEWLVECKSYNDLQFDSMMLNNQGKLEGFWNVALAEAKKHGKRPLLIAKQSRMGTYVLLRKEDALRLSLAIPKAIALIPFGEVVYFFSFEYVLENAKFAPRLRLKFKE